MADDKTEATVARIGEASPAAQAYADAILNNVQANLEEAIRQLPFTEQAAAREMLTQAMSSARADVAKAGPNALNVALKAHAEVTRVVGASIVSAEARAAFGAALYLDKVDTVLNEQERLTLRRDIAAMMAEDEIFGALSKDVQAELTESAAKFVETTPELAKQAQFQQANAEATNDARGQMRKAGEDFRALKDSPEMAPFHDRLEAVEKMRMKRMTQPMVDLMAAREVGTITNEQFVAGMESETKHMTEERAKMLGWKRKQMAREHPEMATAFDTYMKDHGLTPETYRPLSRDEMPQVKAAYQHRKDLGGDFSKLSKEDQILIARAEMDSNVRAGNEIRNVTDAIVKGRSNRLQQELTGKTPQERVDYMMDKGMIDWRVKDEALAMFKAYHGKDDELFKSNQRDLGRAIRALDTDARSAEESVNRIVESTKFSNEIKDLVDSLTEKGWAKYVSADGSRTFDKDGDSKVEMNEIKEVLRKNGVTRLDKIDKDKDGELSRDELVQALTPIVQKEGAKIR